MRVDRSKDGDIIPKKQTRKREQEEPMKMRLLKDCAARQLEKIREVFDIDPNGFAPRVVIVPWDISTDPRNEQFMNRAAAIVGV